MVRVALFLLLLPVFSSAQDIIVTPQGYRIYPVAKHSGSSLSFEGRCDQGPPCRDLRLTGCMKNSKGRTICLPATVQNAGTAGRLFESEPVRVDVNKAGWYVSSVRAECAGR